MVCRWTLGRQVGLFCRHTNIQQKIFTLQLKNYENQFKKFMATGIAQKSCTALFLLWSLRKNDISKNKKYIYKEGTQKALKGLLNNCRKK